MMLHHLSNYLANYGQVSIPQVGSLRLVQRPPVLAVADKLLEPPSYAVEISSDEIVTEHQVNFLDCLTGKGKEAVVQELHSFGDAVRRKMEAGGFDWEGLGTIKENTRSLPFTVAALQAITAQKVIRQNATHTVLVGDKELRSAQGIEQTAAPVPVRKGRSIPILTGWILLFFSLLAIAVLLYSGNFTVSATGSRLSPKSWIKLNEEPSQP